GGRQPAESFAENQYRSHRPRPPGRSVPENWTPETGCDQLGAGADRVEPHPCRGRRSGRPGASAEEARFREDEVGQGRGREAIVIFHRRDAEIAERIFFASPSDRVGKAIKRFSPRSRRLGGDYAINAAKLIPCSPTMRSAWSSPGDAAIPSRRIPTATTFNATATVWSMRAPFAGWKRRHRFSPAVTPTTSATGLRTPSRWRRSLAPSPRNLD